MTEQQSSALTQRLERLEQEVRRHRRERHWWRLAGSGAVVALVAVLLVGATGSKVAEEIRARQFTLVDGKGMPHAKLWKTTTDGVGGPPGDETRMSFFDKDGEERLALGVFQGLGIFPQEPTIALFDKTPNINRGLLKLARDGSPGLVLYDKDGQKSQITTELPSQGRAWVLWGQGISIPPIAMGAWSTKSECEGERSQRETGRGGGVVFACLPDTVNLRSQR